MTASGLRLDLHNHTWFSADGVMSPAALLAAAKANGLDWIAVTDHNTTEGALQALELTRADPGLPGVIPGIEVSTSDGDVIGLYVQRPIPSGLPAAETMALIREQGGLVYLPHPFAIVRRGAIARHVRDQAAARADLVEVLNGRSLSAMAARKSRILARAHGKPRGAGSDAHGTVEVGRAYVTVSRAPSREDLVSLVQAGEVAPGLRLHEYLLNWALQPLSVMTRFRRTRGGALSRR
jgi:predicted metal-dependent phosphoesterase TrpH